MSYVVLLKGLGLLLLSFLSLTLSVFAQDTDDDFVDNYANIPQIRTEDGAFVLGDPDAPVTIIAFEDFACPHCQAYEITVQQFISDYVVTGQAKLEYRFFPIVDPTYSALTAQFAECADTLREGAFWQAREILFEIGSNGRFNEDTITSLAERLNLPEDELLDCASDAQQFEVDMQYGADLGIAGTPGIRIRYGDSEPVAIIVNGQTYDRGGVPYDILAAAVENGEDVSQLPDPTPTAPPLLDDSLLHDDSLISGEPCFAPCWQGITPGETSWEDALQTIEENPEFRSVEIPERSDYPSLRQVLWNQVDGQLCCQILARDGEIVSAVFLQLAPNLTLGELIVVYGDPQYVIGTPYVENQAIMNLIYPDIQTQFSVFVAGAGAGELSENSELIGVLILTSQDMDLVIQTYNLHAWEGYQSYQDYEQGEFEVTPSVTLTPTP